MKKRSVFVLLAVLLCLICVFVLSACGNDPEAPTPDDGNQTEQGGNEGGADSGETPHTHVWGDWTVTVPATCLTTGRQTRTCVCGTSEMQAIPTTDAHLYGVDNKCTLCHSTLQYTEGLAYTLNSDGVSYSVTKGTATDTDIVIPPYHEEKPVTSIGSYAFDGCSSLTSITIPAGVTSIGDSAFSSCGSLTAVHITDLTAWCKIEFGNYFANPLYYAQNLYVNGTLITHLEIPTGVTSIKDCAFYSCTSITSVTISASVTSISEGAFYNCNRLTSIKIPASVTKIGSRAFSACSALANMTVENGNTVYHSAGNCLIETASKTLIAGCKNSVIPTDGSVTSIDSYAFEYCNRLTSIKIPASVTKIGSRAFV